MRLRKPARVGFDDFRWIKYVPSVVAGLGNSVAIWAVAAFLLTYYLGRSAGRGMPSLSRAPDIY
jgi:hypothetical protein